MEQVPSKPFVQIADLLQRAEELEKRHSEIARQAQQALELPKRTLKVFLESGYEYMARSGKRNRIWYRRPAHLSMRIKDGEARYYAAVDHFFRVAEGDADPPDQLVVVPILDSVHDLYESRTGRNLTRDEEVRIELCLDRIEEALDRGIDLFEVSKASIEPLESLLVVTRQHLEQYLSRLEQ